MASAGWLIREDQGLRIDGPAGVEIRFPYKKVDELLLVLALAGDCLERDGVAEKLWPNRSVAERRTNLRQALSQLRKTIGEENLVADRFLCGLRPGFPIRVDDGLKRSRLRSIAVPESHDSPVAGFEKTLIWLSKEDPAQMLKIMRASHDLLAAISNGIMSSILARGEGALKHDPSLVGWVLYWQSNLVFNASQRKRIANKALRWAVQEGDKELVVSCISSLVSAQMTSGQTEEALGSIQAARNFVGIRNSPLASKLDSLRGVVLLHAGQAKAGLDLLQPSPGSNALLESTTSLALKALYLADSGEGIKALEVMEYPRRIAEESGHFNGAMLCDLALATAVSQDDPELALELFDRVISRSSLDSRLDLIAREAAGAIHFRLGSRKEAANLIGGAAKVRHQLGYVFTAWDRLRLQQIPRIDLMSFQPG